MPAPTPAEVKYVADTSSTTAALTLTLNNAVSVGDRIYVIGTIRGFANTLFPLTESLGNTLGAQAAGGSPNADSYYIYSYVVTNAGTPTFTITKNGGATATVCSLTAIVIAAADDDGVDGTYKSMSGTSSGSSVTAYVTLDAATIATNYLVALLLTSNTARTTPTAQSEANVTYTDSGAINDLGSPNFVQTRVLTGPTSALGTYNPGWLLNKANADRYFCIGFAIKGATTDPVISGGTAAPVHGSTGNTLTGSNFGGSQGAGGAVIGGQAQVETAWADGTVTYTADRGVNLNGVAVNAVVTNNGGTPSNSYALTGFDPPAGYEYVTLTSVNATASYRITAIADLAIGNQLEWDDPLVTINADGTYVADPSVTQFNVRVGVTGDGWGALALQTINAASPGGANSATGGRFIRPFNKRVGLGF